MRHWKAIRSGLCIAASLLFVNCGLINGTEDVVEAPNAPSVFMGRPVEVQGTISVSKRSVTFRVWDSEVIDGDRITLVVNGTTILSDYTLSGSKRSIAHTLQNQGYNYILLYAHNTGTLWPNTAALSIDDGSGEHVLVLSANLNTNGAYHIYVQQ